MAYIGTPPANRPLTSFDIGENNITSFNISEAVIETLDIVNGSVTEEKLAANAVTTAKIADGAVNTAELADNSITTAKLNTGFAWGHGHSLSALSGNVSVAQLPDVGITAGTYGNATSIPAVTVNSKGQVTAVSNVAVAGGFSGMSVITSTQTWTIPAGVTRCKVTVVGGGGGGGSTGPGGTGGTSNVASGTQIITPFILATGGTGGRYPGSGAGGTATGGTLNIVGGAGGAGGSHTSAGSGGIDAGEGGSSILGGGAPTGEPSSGFVPGVAATGYGGGGSGESRGLPYGGSGGGGGGGAAIRYLTNLTPGNTLTVTIGGGGVSATSPLGDGFQGVVVFEY